MDSTPSFGHRNQGLIAIVAIIYLAVFITWIFQLVRLSKRKSKVAFALILIFGLALPILPLITFISLFIGRGEEKKEYFWCGICQTKCSYEIFGAETIPKGEICRFCLIKKRQKKKRKIRKKLAKLSKQK